MFVVTDNAACTVQPGLACRQAAETLHIEPSQAGIARKAEQVETGFQQGPLCCKLAERNGVPIKAEQDKRFFSFIDVTASHQVLGVMGKWVWLGQPKTTHQLPVWVTAVYPIVRALS
jgi:hypothetical protein